MCASRAGWGGEFVQGASRTVDSLGARLAPHDELAEKRIVCGRHAIPRIEVTVHADAETSWGVERLDEPGVRPKAVSGTGGIAFWKDGREVADTVQVMIELASGVSMFYDASLANSFDAEYEVLFGSDAAVTMRENKAWLFKEVDAALLGWEVYASKETFYKETGIVLKAGASKSVQQPNAAQEEPFVNTPLSFALTNFLRNSADLTGAAEDYTSSYGDDKTGLLEALAKVPRRPAAGFLEGYQATVTAIKANEAVMSGQRITIPRNLYELA